MSTSNGHIGNHRIIIPAECNSTNLFIAEEIAKGRIFRHGDIIITTYQKDGRGMGANSWESEAGKNLTFSIYLEPTVLRADQQFYLNIFVALSVHSVLSEMVKNEEVSIKWPNDIYIRDKKIAGILIQNTVQGNEILYSIAGIGLNVNQTEFKSDAPNPASLIHFTKHSVETELCLSMLIEMMDKHWLQLKHRNFSKLKSDYLRALFGLEVDRKYIYEGRIIEAKITGISDFGSLQLETVDSGRLECDMKEIKFVL